MAKTPGFKITRSIPDLLAKQSRPAILPDTGWWKVGASEPNQVSFQNSWANAGSSSAPASWYLSEDGETRLRGRIGGGSVNTVAFELPEEVRPEYVEVFVCPVDDNGNVDLSGIKFRAHQQGDV